MTVLRPDGYALPEAVMAKARQAAATGGGAVTESADRAEAMRVCQAIYATSWPSCTHCGNKAGAERFKLELRGRCVDEPWFDAAADGCHFMHCLPVRRGVTVTDRIPDGPRGVVLHQSRNRMLVQTAVL